MGHLGADDIAKARLYETSLCVEHAKAQEPAPAFPGADDFMAALFASHHWQGLSGRLDNLQNDVQTIQNAQAAMQNGQTAILNTQIAIQQDIYNLQNTQNHIQTTQNNMNQDIRHIRANVQTITDDVHLNEMGTEEIKRLLDQEMVLSCRVSSVVHPVA